MWLAGGMLVALVALVVIIGLIALHRMTPVRPALFAYRGEEADDDRHRDLELERAADRGLRLRLVDAAERNAARDEGGCGPTVP